jgi:hypothetical protein
MSDLEEEYRQHFVYSPADGVIVDINFSEGDRAWGKVFSVADPNVGVFEVLMPVNADNRTPAQMALMELDIGDPVVIIYQGIQYDGEIFRDIGRYYMEIGYDPQDNHTQALTHELPGGITFGKNATLRNIVEQSMNAVVIPMGEVYSADDEPYTYVVEGENIEKRYIELGMDDGYFYEVLSGLEEGEMILKVN